MQNDMLKNNIAPWQEKGRWYHGLWDCSTHSFIADESDSVFSDGTTTLATATINSAVHDTIQFGEKRPVTDVKVIPRGKYTISASAMLIPAYRIYVLSGGINYNGVSFCLHTITKGLFDVYFFVCDNSIE